MSNIKAKYYNDKEKYMAAKAIEINNAMYDSDMYYAEQKGIEKGRAEGIEQGADLKQIEIIQTMYKNGFDIDTISKATDLDIEYIKKILVK